MESSDWIRMVKMQSVQVENFQLDRTYCHSISSTAWAISGRMPSSRVKKMRSAYEVIRGYSTELAG